MTPFVPFDEVEHLPVSVLNYAIWREMAGNRPPPQEMQHGAELAAKLDAKDASALADFGRRAWKFVCEEAARGTNPPYEAEARRRIRSALPSLDDWTFDNLWITAYRYGMM
jgi:hypothetical protein